MNVIRLNSQSKNRPPFFITLLLNQNLTAVFNGPCEYGLAATWTPDQMIDNQMNSMFVALICMLLDLCLFHVTTIHQEKTEWNQQGLKPARNPPNRVG